MICGKILELNIALRSWIFYNTHHNYRVNKQH